MDSAVYSDRLEKRWAFAISRLARSSQKWSTRMETAFAQAGLVWADEEREVKREVVAACVAKPEACIRDATAGPIEALVSDLESRLQRPGLS